MKQAIASIWIMLLIACQNNGKQTDNTVSADTTSSLSETDQAIPDTSPATTAGEESQINKLLRTFRSDLRVVQVKDIYEKDTPSGFAEDLAKERKVYAGYPFIAIGDFNGDNITDYAAIVTDGKVEYTYINTWLVMFPSGSKPVITDAYSSLNSVLKTVKTGTVLKDPFEEKPDRTLKYDAILLTNGDGPGGYMVWDGKKFESVFWEG